MVLTVERNRLLRIHDLVVGADALVTSDIEHRFRDVDAMYLRSRKVCIDERRDSSRAASEVQDVPRAQPSDDILQRDLFELPHHRSAAVDRKPLVVTASCA